MTSVVYLNNASFIYPPTFYINGFYNVPHAKYYYIFLCFLYAVTIFGNSFIMGTIYLARALHTAKYIAVLNLAVSDLCGSTALIPRYVDMFLFNKQYISYGECLSSMFFMFFFMSMQSFTLLALAFDRVIAICFPLRYHAIVTKTTMMMIIGVMWVISVGIIALLVSLITRLTFCGSTTVDSYFCDHGPVFRLACNDNFPNRVMAYVYSAVAIFIPLLLIAFSYGCIGFALFKISHGGERMKAMKTCTSHLILVAMFFLPILSVYFLASTTYLHPNTRIINSILTQTVPPMLNPIIYTLKTEEVLQSIKVLYKRIKVSTMEQPVKRILRN
ncbi:olfactory receptor 3-like [Astyanax mexicanus]|uniref:olfactory receptor 3-like n=1 Tax=Astyanax mexicanus TaxID=7994 RepID=UPI000BBD9050|nr:olfactory receptor 3-like [Astyanax mexicanus]